MIHAPQSKTPERDLVPQPEAPGEQRTIFIQGCLFGTALPQLLLTAAEKILETNTLNVHWFIWSDFTEAFSFAPSHGLCRFSRFFILKAEV